MTWQSRRRAYHKSAVHAADIHTDTAVLYMDVDMVLQADPWAALPKEGYDIITSMDHSFVHCTGFMAMRTTQRNMDFLSEWEQRIEHSQRSNFPAPNPGKAGSSAT